jgi:hypothetical protein
VAKVICASRLDSSRKIDVCVVSRTETNMLLDENNYVSERWSRKCKHEDVMQGCVYVQAIRTTKGGRNAGLI